MLFVCLPEGNSHYIPYKSHINPILSRMKKRFALVFHPSIPGQSRQAATLEIVPILVLVGIEVIPEAPLVAPWIYDDLWLIYC